MATTDDDLSIPDFLRRPSVGKANPAVKPEPEPEPKPAPATVARPLRVLVGLIRNDLQQGNEAAERAGLPYYRAAGEKMLEAKSQMLHGEFGPWLKRTFSIKERQARYYMSLVRATSDAQNGTAVPFASLDEFRRAHLGEDRSARSRGHHAPIDARIGSFDDAMARAEEREAQRRLALQLIDIGFKALASKLHPDKGGSPAAMSRLNQVRDRLRARARLGS